MLWICLNFQFENYILKRISSFLKVYMKTETAIIKFGDIEMEKQKSHQHKKPI